MVDIDEVARMVLELPDVTEGERYGTRAWSVAGETFVWERPFSKADLRRFGDSTPPMIPPGGVIIGVQVDDLGEKEAALAANPESFFTIPHFDGYAAVLIQLSKVGKRALREAIVDGWLACAPRTSAEAYVARVDNRRH